MGAVRVASTNGVTLAVHDLGGTGATLLLCHATGFHGLVMAPLAMALSSRFRVFALDFRGHGRSDRPSGTGGYPWSGFGDDVLATVDALPDQPGAGPGSLLGVGHSMGGAALFLAEQSRPGTFAGLYCFEPIVFPPDPAQALVEDQPLVEASRRRRQVFASREEAYANYATKAPLSALTPDALRAYVEHGFVDRDDGSVTLACRSADEAEIYRMAPANGAYDRLGEVACPVTVAAGAHSGAFTPEAAATLAGRLPAGRAEVFEHLGHFGPLEDPPAVAESVAAAFSEAGAVPGENHMDVTPPVYPSPGCR
jgi:pimeloyl-ACP methyl ester carboxylesterase